MLVLTRNIGQCLIINDNITVRIMGVQGKQIRLSIDAPKEIPIHREEIQKLVEKERKRIQENLSCSA